MIKNIMKEIIIIILSILAILLILGIILYDYNPNTKTISAKIEKYDLPENTQQELQRQLPNNSQVIVQYTVEASDLNRYEKNDEYNKGKANPFGKYTQSEENSNNSNQEQNTNTTKTNTTFPETEGK